MFIYSWIDYVCIICVEVVDFIYTILCKNYICDVYNWLKVKFSFYRCIIYVKEVKKKTRTTRLIKRQDNIFMGARTCENSPALLTHNIIFIFYCDRRVLGTLVVIEWRYLFHGVHVPRCARTSHVQYKQPPMGHFFASKTYKVMKNSMPLLWNG